MNESLERMAARAEVYKLLAIAYYTPDVGFLKVDFLSSLAQALDTLEMNSCTEGVRTLSEYLQKAQEADELAVEYTRLFRGPVRAQVYPYESMHTEGEVMGNSTLDVLRRYGEAGVGVSEEFKDLPDHISVELEFVHYLCRRELESMQKANDSEWIRFRDMRRAFLRDHLNKWVPQLCGKIRESGNTCFYSGLADVTEEWIRNQT